jgi:aspartate kinase
VDLQVLHPSAMLPAQSMLCTEQLAIRVRNSYNLEAPGSVICDDRNIAESLLTSIVLKPDVRLLDVVSTRMLGNYGFLARVFDIFKGEQVSVDVVATSEISVSVTLDCARLWSRDLIADELDRLAQRFEGIAKVKVASNVSIVSLICNAARSSAILKRVRACMYAVGGASSAELPSNLAG